MDQLYGRTIKILTFSPTLFVFHFCFDCAISSPSPGLLPLIESVKWIVFYGYFDCLDLSFGYFTCDTFSLESGDFSIVSSLLSKKKTRTVCLILKLS
jgi:hypothetical protein